MRTTYALALLALSLTTTAEAQQIERLFLEGKIEWATVSYELYNDRETHSIWGGLVQVVPGVSVERKWRAHSNSSINFHHTRIELEFHVPENSNLKFIPTYGSIGEIAEDVVPHPDFVSGLHGPRRYLMSGVCEVLPNLAAPELVECGLTMQFSDESPSYGNIERPNAEPRSLWLLIDLETLEVDAQQNGNAGGERLIPGTLRIVDR